MGMTPQHFHTIPTSFAILPLLTQISFLCLLVVCKGLWKAVWWVHFDVHRNDTTTLSHNPYTSFVILPLLTQICFLCLLVVCRGLWKAVWWVHFDVHRVWVIVVGGCNVQCTWLYWARCQTWSVLPVCRNCGDHGHCWVYVWYVWVCMVYGLFVMLNISYVVKFYCTLTAEHGRYGSMEDWGEQCWVPCSFSVYMNTVESGA